MNLEICHGTGISVKGVRARCSWNDCRGNEKKVANCSEQGCQTKDFGVGELWEVELRILQEYLKVNYRAVLFSLIAFWYFFVVFVPYLTTGKLGELQLGLNGYTKNSEYDMGKEFIDRCNGFEEFVGKVDGAGRGDYVKGSASENEDWVNIYLEIEKGENERRAKGREGEIGVKGRKSEDEEVRFKGFEKEGVRGKVEVKEEIGVKGRKSEDEGIRLKEFEKEGVHSKVKVKGELNIKEQEVQNARLGSYFNGFEMGLYGYRNLLSLGEVIQSTGLVLLVLTN